MSEIHVLGERVKAGDADAQHKLGVMLMLGREAPHRPLEGARLVDMAAAQDFTPALRLAGVLRAVGFERPLDWREAMRLVRRAAELGDAEARAELAALGDGFDAASTLAPNFVFEQPRIAIVEGVLSPAMCDWIVARAASRLSAAQMYDPEQGGRSAGERRTNTGMGFALAETDLVLQAAHARIAAASGLALANQEPTNVLHYAPGQEFLPHFDSLDSGVAHFARDLEINGQRALTFLIYLNDDYEGGETAFPRLNWKHKGAKGDGLMFWNVGPDGLRDEATLHAGLAPISGEKWLLSKWVRDKALPLL
jgi:prolyl 4-hydroxylase